MDDTETTELIVRPLRRRNSSLPHDSITPSASTRGSATEFIVEWELHSWKRVSPFTLVLELNVIAKWSGEELSWKLNKASDQVFNVDPQVTPRTKNSLQLSSLNDEELARTVEEHLELCGRRNPKAVLRFFEASRWTFAKENIYNESLGPKLKEGELVKAPGGYESYHRSRWRVLLAQVVTIAISVSVWATMGFTWVLSVGFAVISLLSVVHWSYYRLSAIDATCVIPCLFIPPVGPILVLVWAVFSFLFPRGDRRWFVLRQGHLEFYEGWASPKREPVGVLLLDRYTEVRKSALFPRKFICSTPYRSLQLWASSKRERDDWVERLVDCVELFSGAGDADGDFISTGFTPMRKNVPIRCLIDGRETFEAVLEAVTNAKKEIYIAGWMLSPELYLRRDRSPTGSALPEVDRSIFQCKSPTIVEFGSKHTYRCTKPVTIASYEFLVAKDVNTRPESASWILKGLLTDGSGSNLGRANWVLIDSRRNVNFKRFCDAGEPIRFHLKRSSRNLLCMAFEFSFMGEEESIREDPDWVDLRRETNTAPFTCGGVRLLCYDTDEIIRDRDEGDPRTNQTAETSESLLAQFFRLFARTEQETQLDRFYRIFTGRSTTTSSSSQNQNEVSLQACDDVEAQQPNEDDAFTLAAQASSFSVNDEVSSGQSFSEEFHARLDRVLAKKVMEGVRCYVVVYRDVDMFLPNASASAKRKLLTRALWNRHMQVLRHAPEGRSYGSVQHFLTCSLSRGKTWWSHHEKIICVDQSIAFLGGLDLAFGRFDDAAHSLWDPAGRVWRGKDYYNPHWRDFVNLDQAPFRDSINRLETPRMPWHDVHCVMGGAAAADVARHFIGRWNAEKRELKPGSDKFRVLLPRYVVPAAEPKPEIVTRVVAETEDLSQGLILRTISGLISFARSSSSNEAELASTLREPLLLANGGANAVQSQPLSQKQTVLTGSQMLTLAPRCECQILRSVAPWSSPSDTERSILDAYLKLIRTSERYIYIEQQFFSSDLAGAPVRNPIARALADRVCRAARANETFKVIVLLPVLPAFEGAIRDNFSARSVLHWNLRTIRGTREYVNKALRYESESVKQRARESLGFYSLRTAQKCPNTQEYHTEQVYIHSKLLIVDDQFTIIGSANLNDRSMLGSRDSEIAVLVRSKTFATDTRERLFSEHTGGQVREPLSDKWDQVAQSNTRILDRAFLDLPRNEFTSFASLPSVSPAARASPAEFSALKGHLIRFPELFLHEETNLLPRVVRGEREGVVPLENFT